MHDNSRLCARAPRTYRFFRGINDWLAQHGIESGAARMHELLEQTSTFTNIQSLDLRVPIGSWNGESQRVGERLRTNLIVLASSMQLWLVENGYCTDMAAQDLVNGFLHEIHTIRGMELKYQIVYARKA